MIRERCALGSVTPKLDDYLSREEVVSELRRLGYPISLGTLETMADHGAGPPYERVPNERGRPTRYGWADALEWAKQTYLDPERWKTRQELAQALTANGYPIRATTLKQWATFRAGPPYQLRGGLAWYDVQAALAWAKARWDDKRSR